MQNDGDIIHIHNPIENSVQYMEIMLNNTLLDHITMKSVHILGKQSQFRNIFNDVVSQLPSLSGPPLALFRVINDPFQAAAAKRGNPKRPESVADV